MAKIALGPGEEFEHYHSEESYTKHLSGKIELSFSDKKLILNDGQSVIIPANTPHSAKNIGNNLATFDCSGHLVTEQQ